MKKSIEVLKCYQEHIMPGSNRDVFISLELAQALRYAATAMEKAIPVEPDKYSDYVDYADEDFWICSACGEYIADVGDDMPNYCWNCGQKVSGSHEFEENN